MILEPFHYRHAGTAIVAHGCRLPITDVSANGITLGISAPPYPRPLCGGRHDVSVRTCRRLLAVAVSGAVAECLLAIMCNRAPVPGPLVSWQIATKGWRQVVSHGGDAAVAGAHAAALGQWANLHEQDLLGFMQTVVSSHERMVDRLLRMRWQAVERVVDGLRWLPTGRLTGDEVERLVGRQSP